MSLNMSAWALAPAGHTHLQTPAAAQQQAKGLGEALTQGIDASALQEHVGKKIRIQI